MAEDDYVCPPSGARLTASERKQFFAASAILHSSSDPSCLALALVADDAVPAFNVRALSPDGRLVQTDRIGARFRASEKIGAATLHLASICPSRLGTYVGQLDYLVGVRAVSDGHHG